MYHLKICTGGKAGTVIISEKGGVLGHFFPALYSSIFPSLSLTNIHYIYKQENSNLYVLKRIHILKPVPAYEEVLKRLEVDSGAPHPINNHHWPVCIALE